MADVNQIAALKNKIKHIAMFWRIFLLRNKFLS